jgi:hypothetical protein
VRGTLANKRLQLKPDPLASEKWGQVLQHDIIPISSNRLFALRPSISRDYVRR